LSGSGKRSATRHKERRESQGSHPPAGEQHAKKKPAFSCELFFKYGGEGGIDSLRSPLLGPSMGLAPLGPTQALFKNAPGVFVRAACSLRSQSVQLAVASCRTPVGDSHPPLSETIKEKARTFVRALALNMAVRGGLTRFARPSGSLFAALAVCPTGCRQLSNPGRGFSSPPFGDYKRKKPALSYELLP